MNRLVGPLRYLRMTHPTKVFIDLILPLLLASILFSARITTADSAGLVSRTGLLELLIPLLGALSGFYIAALTAVSAFPIESLDKPMPGDPITIIGELQPKKNPTRRQFLSVMFGYLAFSSICLFLICVFSIYLKPMITSLSQMDFIKWMQWPILLFILFWLFNIICVTFFAIYYLSDRIHQSDATLRGGPDEPKIRSE
jgi:hypothetical protein